MIMPHFAPEQCGVSDYVLCWKKWLGQGADVFIAALSDRYHTGILQGPGLLRIGAEQPLRRVLGHLRHLLAHNRFDAVVIHYVPQGYGRHGLPLWLVKPAGMVRKLQIPVTLLAHEIWSGGAGKPLRVQLKGWLQKQFLLFGLRLMGRPQLITTSAYTAGQLSEGGMAVAFCPVFSNVGETEDAAGIPERVLQAVADPAFVQVLMFGSIPPDALPKDTAGFLSLLSSTMGKPVRVWHAGHASPQAFLPVAGCMKPGIMAFEHLGPLPATAINWLMRHCHWGLSTYPIELWSKSGSIAAMLANGLPVAVTGRLSGAALQNPLLLPQNLVCWPTPDTGNLMGGQKTLPARMDKPQWAYNQGIARRLHALTGYGMEPGGSGASQRLSVVITVYRCWPKALKCLQHLFERENNQLVEEVLLVNDDPADTPPAALAGYSKVKLVQNERNLGYVASVNRGMGLAACNLVLLLDADAFLLDNLLPALNLLDQEPALKMVLPAARMQNGLAVRRLYPSPRFSSLLMGQGFESFLERFRFYPQTIAHSYAWLMYRDDFMMLGGLDSSLHFVEADVDYCMRLHAAYPGSVVVCEAVRVEHEGGANPIRRNQRVLEWYRSRWYLLQKHELIPFKPIARALIRLRLYLESGLAALLSYLQPARSAFWRQKSEGRKMLLKDLENW